MPIDVLRCGMVCWQLEEAKPGAGLAIGVADMSLFFPTMQNLGVGEGSWCYSKTGQASIGGAAGFSDYGETFTHGCTVGVVLDMDAGTLRFTKDGVDQGIACCTGIRGRVLSPGVVMGTNKGGKRTRVTIIRSGACQTRSDGLGGGVVVVVRVLARMDRAGGRGWTQPQRGLNVWFATEALASVVC